MNISIQKTFHVFFILLVLVLFSINLVCSKDEIDRKVVANEVLTVISLFDMGGRDTKPDIEQIRRHVNPQNATAAIEIIPELLREEPGDDAFRSTAYIVFISHHRELWGYVNPEVFFTIAHEVKKLENARWHSLCAILIQRALRNADDEEKESLLEKVVGLFPFERPGDNVTFLTPIFTEYSIQQALIVIDYLVETYSDNEYLVRELGYARQALLRNMDHTLDDHTEINIVH